VAATVRLFLLALALAYALVVGPVASLAAGAKAHRHKGTRVRAQRTAWLKGAQLIRPMTVGQRAVSYARRFVGVPYRYGGSSPSSGFDCSGFVRFVYHRFGIELPHSSYADFGLGRRVARAALQPGDLVFFDGVGHVGLYVGGGRFIHAPHSGTRVQITTLADYGSSYVGARRIVSGVKRRLLGG
jgi:cell wall-associated NlpC family hydrolase